LGQILFFTIWQFAIFEPWQGCKKPDKAAKKAAKTLKTRESEKMKGCVDSKVMGIAFVNNL
jgi:hypothetical protein